MTRPSHHDPRPSLTLRTVGEQRLRLVRELEREFEETPAARRLGRLAAMTLVVCSMIIFIAYAVQMVVR